MVEVIIKFTTEHRTSFLPILGLNVYLQMIFFFFHLRAGVSFPPSFISSLNVEIKALEMKSIRMIDSLTLAWRLFTFSTRSPIARAAAGCTEEKQQAV